jgi:hypothetical protein
MFENSIYPKSDNDNIRVCNCCITPNEQFLSYIYICSYIMVRIRYCWMRWWWGPLCNRPTCLDCYNALNAVYRRFKSRVIGGVKVSVPALNAVYRRFKSQVIGGVKVSVPSTNAVDRRFKSRVKPRPIPTCLDCYNAPLGHIILIPTQPVLALSH